jgi:FkbM family methyltransferase
MNRSITQSLTALRVFFVSLKELKHPIQFWLTGHPFPEISIRGVRIMLPARDFREKMVNIRMAVECIVDEQYTKHLNLKGMTVVDIGAHIGCFTMFAVKKKAFKVYSVEPSRETCSHLCFNVHSHDINNVKITNSLISSEKTGYINIDENNRAANSMYINTGDKEEMRCMTLNEFMEKNDIFRPDLLKIDIEGAEYDLFKTTSMQTIRMFRHISMGWHDPKHFNVPGDHTGLPFLISLLRSHGYNVWYKSTNSYQGLLRAERID